MRKFFTSDLWLYSFAVRISLWNMNIKTAIWKRSECIVWAATRSIGSYQCQNIYIYIFIRGKFNACVILEGLLLYGRSQDLNVFDKFGVVEIWFCLWSFYLSVFCMVYYNGFDLFYYTQVVHCIKTIHPYSG